MASKLISLKANESYEVSNGEIIEKVLVLTNSSTVNGFVTLFSRILFKKEGENFTLDVDGEGVSVTAFSISSIEGPFYKVATDPNTSALIYIK